jgi:hypothetical protein
MPDRDPTVALLSRMIGAARRDAERSDGQLTDEQIGSLERLARLVAIERDMIPRRRRRWPLAAVFLVTLTLVSVLFFARVGETEVELDLVVDELAFRLPGKQVLTHLLRVDDLGAAGLDEFTMPAIDSVSKPVTMQTSSLKIAVREMDGQRGELSLAALAPPEGSKVWIRSGVSANRIRVSLLAAFPQFRVDAFGPVEIRSREGGAVFADLRIPKPLGARAGDGMLDLSLGLSNGVAEVFRSQLQFEDLSLVRIDEDSDISQSHLRRESTVRSGTLYFEALDGRARAIRPGEMLEFEQARGWIRKIELGEEGLTVMLRMTVAEIRTGWDGSSRSLMPTYLEWLRARHGLYLLWGTVGYLFSLALSLLRWWGSEVG